MKNIFTTYFTTNCFAITLLLSHEIHAQSSFITPISWHEFNVPTGKEGLLDSLLVNSIYDTIIPVEVGYLPDFQENGLLEFTIPGITDTVYSIAQQVEFLSEDNYTWRGRIIGSDGDMILIENNSDIYGYFYLDSLLEYELIDLGGHSNLLAKYKEEIINQDSSSCGVNEEDFESLKDNNFIIKRDACEQDAKNIRILILYTSKAAQKIQPGQKANLYVKELNMALSNSGISEDEVHFEISEINELNGFEETNDLGDDLATLKNAVLNNSPDIREESGSDLVVLFVDGDYGNIVGYAYQNNWGNSDFGFAVLEVDCPNRYTFAHEVAHTFGCRHIFDNTQLPEYAHSYYWKSNGKRRSTLMTPGTNKTRILHYSNPDVYFDGHVTGHEDYNNNARQLREANDVVADNFCFEPLMMVWISGPVKGVEDTQYVWVANTLFCDEIENYHWEISTDGITYNTYINNGSAYYISLYLPEDLELFIRLTVTCDDSQEITDFLHVYNLDNDFDHPYITLDENSTIYDTTINWVVASPNPSSGDLTFKLELLKPSKISLYRRDLSGKSFLISKLNCEKGLNTLKDNKSSELVGIYYYTIISDSESLHKAVLFIK